MKKKIRDREGSEQALLQAAVTCFAEQGFEGATTRSIAERAGLSEGLIHRYFGSKEGLLVELMRRFMRENTAYPVLQSQPGASLAPVLSAFFRQLLAHHREVVDAMRVLVSRAIIDKSVGTAMGKDIWQSHVEQLHRVLAEFGPADGQDVEAAAFVLSAFSFVLGFMGPQVFGFAPDRLAQVGDWLARAIEGELAREES